MIYRKEFNEIINVFKSICPNPYELIVNIVLIIDNYQFFKNSELSIYSNINIDDYPVVSKIKMDINVVQAIGLITSIKYRDYSNLVMVFRFYIEKYLYIHLDEECPICSYKFGLMMLKYDDISGIGCPDCGYLRDFDDNVKNMRSKIFFPLKNEDLVNFKVEIFGKLPSNIFDKNFKGYQLYKD